jgi:crotonobetaine/carnitine-CoA ligase
VLEPELLLPKLIEHRARTQPDRVYLEEVGGKSHTYAQVHAGALRWTAALQHAGVEPHDHVVSMLPTSPEMVEVWLGIAWAGAVEVPVNIAYRGRMLEYVLDDSGAEVLVVHARYASRLADVAPAVLRRLRKIVVLGGRAVAGQTAVDDFLGAPSEPARPVEPHHYDIGSMLYTSGTTGPSKGVLVPWMQMHATTVGSVPSDDLTGDDAYYAPFPLFHISGKFPLYLMALCGGRTVLREAFDTKVFWSDIAELRCTTTLLLGAMANFINRQPPGPDDAATPLRNVIMVPLIPELDEFRERFGVRVCTTFNMSEVSAPLSSGGWEPANTTSCGRPRAGYECRVVDEHDERLPPNTVGELVVRTDEPWKLMAGYWGKPEATARAWRNQWLHTGDAFMYDEEGNFYFVDRMKDAIRRRGENISSMEVEADINRHPAVLESAVVAVPSEWGEDDVKAVIVLKPGEAVAHEELLRFLVDHLPHFMVPRYLEFVDELPKTETQKIRKTVLRDAGVTPATWDREASGIKVARSA